MAVFGKKKNKKADAEIASDIPNDSEQIAADIAIAEDATPTATLAPEDKKQMLAGVEDAVRDAEEKEARARARQAKRDAALEAKHSHVVAGTVRHVPKGEEIDGMKSKGRVCDVACVDCGTIRTVNVQDAFQVRRCKPCTEEHLKRRQQERRAARRKTKTDDEPVNDSAE